MDAEALPSAELIAGHLQELRRGTVVLACLLVLRTPGYGYALLESLATAGIVVDANTLYPLLRRLEKQGLLTSEWNTEEPRPRKFYHTSAAGDRLARFLTDGWTHLNSVMTGLMSGAAPSGDFADNAVPRESAQDAVPTAAAVTPDVDCREGEAP